MVRGSLRAAGQVLDQRAAAARPRSGRATETMIAGHDCAILDFVWIDIPKKKRSVAFFAANQLTILARIGSFTWAKYKVIISR